MHVPTAYPFPLPPTLLTINLLINPPLLYIQKANKDSSAWPRAFSDMIV